MDDQNPRDLIKSLENEFGVYGTSNVFRHALSLARQAAAQARIIAESQMPKPYGWIYTCTDDDIDGGRSVQRFVQKEPNAANPYITEIVPVYTKMQIEAAARQGAQTVADSHSDQKKDAVMTNRVISSLPNTHEAVNSLPLYDMADLVVTLAAPDIEIKGIAALQVNAFLSHAAVRMAKCLKEFENVSKPNAVSTLDP